MQASLRVVSKALTILAFRPDGARLATADATQDVRVWEGDRLLWERSMTTPDLKLAALGRIRSLAWSPAGETLYALGAEGLLALDGASGERLWEYEPPRALGFLAVSATALAVRRDGTVAAAFDDGKIGAWDPDGALQGLWRDVDTQRRLAFLRDGRLLGDDSFGLSVFDVESRARLHRTPLSERAYGLAVAPDGNVAVRTLHEAWQISPSGAVFARTPTEPGLPTLAYHPGTPLLALGSARGAVLIDLAGEIARRFDLPDAPVTSLAFRGDGTLAVGDASGGLRLLPT